MTAEPNSNSSARHRAREVALQTLFAMDLQARPERDVRVEVVRPQTVRKGPIKLRRKARVAVAIETRNEPHPEAPPVPVSSRPSSTVDEVFNDVAEHFEMPHAAHGFARDLVAKVIEHADALDEIVSSHARNWRVDRMAIVDRNVLRLAAFELMHTETPAAVILDEAVELARRFGSDESPPFVNGVLDAVAREVRGEDTR
ncbi:MAG TPA: transcription antitermination factor NusB [Myxococcales bacterium]|jgi:N utilization substance protein B|nr:transcription antitermination factor NusB [Myxococcales bacterium]HIM00997.1 transcription antitermination factor NusB [Myxococcales bacterium]